MLTRISKIAAAGGRRAVLYARGFQQSHRFRFELSVRAPRAFNGHDLSRQSRHVPRPHVTSMHVAFYCSIICWEIADGDFSLWWGIARLAARPAFACCEIQRGQARAVHRPYAFAVDVAGRVSGNWRRMVPDVAVERLERAGSCRSETSPLWDFYSYPAATGHRSPTLT